METPTGTFQSTLRGHCNTVNTSCVYIHTTYFTLNWNLQVVHLFNIHAVQFLWKGEVVLNIHGYRRRAKCQLLPQLIFFNICFSSNSHHIHTTCIHTHPNKHTHWVRKLHPDPSWINLCLIYNLVTSTPQYCLNCRRIRDQKIKSPLLCPLFHAF